METWFIYALLSGLLAGGVSFLNKVSAHHKQDGVFVSFYSSVGGLFLGLIFFLLYVDVEEINALTTLIGILSGIFIYLVLIFRIQSLKYIDTTVFFPLYKTFGPLFAIAISFFVFQENVSFLEGLGLFVGLLVPLFILNKDNLNRNNFKLGITFMALCVIFSIMPGYFGKLINTQELSIVYYLMLVNLSGVIIGLMQGGKKVLQINKSKVFGLWVGLLGGVMYYISGYFFVNALVGNLAIVFSINSFSFLIPIVLSVFYYKEHFDFKKALAIFFTLVSLYLMK